MAPSTIDSVKTRDASPQPGEEKAPDAAAGVKRPASDDEEEEEDDSTAKKQAPDDNKQPFTGSCHCGKIQYEIKLNPENLSATRCNCTFCQKLSATNISIANPTADFTLLRPSSREELDDYAPRMKSAHRYFCRGCGTHVFGEGYYEFEGTKHDFFALNAVTLDQPQDPLDLSKIKLKYWDALHDNWTGGLSDKPWPCGLP